MEFGKCMYAFLIAISYIFYLPKTSLRFLFSFDFFEIKEVKIEKARGITPPSFAEIIQNNVYNNALKMLNIGKIIFWLMALFMLLAFLFKKPKE